MNFYPTNTGQLIQALQTAQSGGPHVIYLQSQATYTLTESYTGNASDATGMSGLPQIQTTVRIVGQGTRIERSSSAVNNFRLFWVRNNGTLTLEGLTLTGGRLSVNPGHGCCISNEGKLTLLGCAIANNTGVGEVYGVGIINKGGAAVANIKNCIITKNTGANGAGIYNNARMTIENSQLSYNAGVGGGAVVSSGGDVRITRCAIFNNTASEGAALRGNRKWLVTECDIYRNTAGGGNNAGSAFYYTPDNPNLDIIRLNHNRIFENRASSVAADIDVPGDGTNADRIDARHNWWGANGGPSFSGNLTGGDSIRYVSSQPTKQVQYLPFLAEDDCIQEAVNDCVLGWTADDMQTTSNPISLRLGEKRVEATDLSLNTPVGPLTFTRVYRQDKRHDPAFQFMGLGWMHNHISWLEFNGSAPVRSALVRLSNGGGLALFERRPDYFQAADGSAAYMTHDDYTDEYVLAGQDGGKFIFFDDTLKLKKRLWPNGDEWDYSYNGSGELEEVTDGPRSLLFAYDEQFGHSLLQSVEDHGGRGVTFSYEPQRDDGQVVQDGGGNSLALLSGVQDVRGEDWAYDYYGQSVGQDDPELLDYMIERVSPAVSGGVITLEKLTYLRNCEVDLAVGGDMQNDEDWPGIVGNPPTSNQYVVGPGDSLARRVITNMAGCGIEEQAWNLVEGKTYTISAEVYLTNTPSNSALKMQVNGISDFDQTTTTRNQWLTLTATETPAETVNNRRVQLISTNSGGATFYVRKVSIIESNPDLSGIDQERGQQGMSVPLLTTSLIFAPHQNLTQEIIADRLSTHHFDRALYVGREDPAGNFGYRSPNNQFRPGNQVDANGNAATLGWNANGSQLERVEDAGGSVTHFTYQSDGVLAASVDPSGSKSVYVYEDADNPRQPTLLLTTNGENRIVNGDMEAEGGWSNVGSPTANQRIPGAQVGAFVRYVGTDAASKGIEQADTWALEDGETYTVSARVFALSGSVRMQVFDIATFQEDTDGTTGDWQTLSATYTHSGSAENVTVRFLSLGGAAIFCVDALTIRKDSDDVGVFTRVDLENNADWDTVGASVITQQVGARVGDFARRVVAPENAGIQSENWSLIENRTYLVLAHVYPVSGVVNMRVPDVSEFEISTTGTGDWETLHLTHEFADAGTAKPLQFIASGGAAEFYVDVVCVLDSDTLLRQQEFDYDGKGRTLEERNIDPADGTTVLQKTQRTYHTAGDGNGLLESVTQVDLEDAGNNQSTTYTYDPAGRVIKTQRSSLFGSCDIAFTVYDLAGNVVATICNYDPGMDPDPTTAEEAAALYNPAEPDKNRMTMHGYDALGRRVETTSNAGADFAQTTLTLLDALDRPWRVIGNYVNPLVSEDPDEYTYTAPGTWTWDEINGRWQDGDDTPIAHGDDNNQNIISDTAYNARGLTRMQRNTLGNVTLYGYDEADRLVKTVQNASDPDYDNDYGSGDPDPDLSEYEAEAGADEDLITRQEYDAAGNLIKSFDALNAATLTAYNALNRPVEVVNSASDPDYNLLAERDFGAYSFSDDPDHDLRSVTTYDALGRTLQTGQLIEKDGEDETWVYIRNVYDELGRQRRSIRNYIDQGEDPALWVWDATDARWEQSNGTPIEYGANNDQNLISEQVYDEAGRVRFSRDMAGTKSWMVYDGLGRQIRQIAGCTYVDGSPAPEDAGYVGDVSDPAADIISETFFDVDGRVIRTRRLLRYDAGEDELVWVWTLTGYDALGRQVKTVQNASDPEYDISADPDLSEYTPSAEPDEDLITETAYDAEGRAYKTTDPLGSVTLHGFDTSGRQMKVIRSASDPDYDVTTDPDLSEYTPSAEADEDLIRQTRYDIAGRVVKTIDPLDQVTLYGYDRAGRRVKVIQNASDPDYDMGDDRDLSGYTGDGPDADQDRISETAYDKAGRTIHATDMLGSVTLTGYDRAGRQVKIIQNASDPDYDTVADRDLSEYTGDSPDDDQDRITTTTHDKGGRAVSVTDAGGTITRHVYDGLGRRIRSVMAYLAQATDPAAWLWDDGQWQDGESNPIGHGAEFDRNLIGDTAYDLAGRVGSIRDARGTLTAFTYDRLGRRLTVTEAVDTDLETVSYTGYDKAGRVERFIQNWQDTGVSPDAKNESGDWVFNPARHGSHNDRDLITVYQHDLAGRRTATTDPAGNTATASYFRDGQVDTETDPEGTVTLFRRDGLRRRVLVVQSFVANGEDPSEWVWDGGDTRYEESDGTPIVHGADSDQNIIVQVTYDKGGRMTHLRNPRGNLTEYDYDRLGRRTRLTNPLNDDWLTAYEDLVGGGSRVTITYPGLTSGGAYSVQRDFDRLGRPVEIDYGDADVTPRVTFAYDPAGNRAVMREYDDSEQIRTTGYGYDTVRRLTQVDFDTDGDDNADETVSYEYDLSGNRTKLTLPGDLSITYCYDAKGQLVGLTDWDGQASDFFYDRAGRHVATQRANGLKSDYRYNPAGHLLRIRHFVGSLSSLRAHFEFQVDGRGNRTQIYERMAEPTTITATYDKDAAEVDYIAGTWADDGDFKKSTQFSAKMTVTWTGDEGLLTMGTGPDHSIFDVYIGGTLWQSYDGYTADPGERVIHLPADALLEIRNRADKNLQSTGYVIRFKQLDALEVTYDERTIQYTYDALSRLTEANYDSGATVYTYGFDLAGNLVNNDGASRTYNAANQLVNDGTNSLTYDANGNLTNDGVNSYVWDRANRLLSMGGISYAYNGDGNRIQQNALKYILDLQPGLAQVIGDSDGNRYVHSPRGIHAMQNPSGAWSYASQDGLGSVRGYVGANTAVLSNVSYTPIGVPDVNIDGPAFTGEWRSDNETQYHRARHLRPGLGVWLSLDPWEGTHDRPMSLNGYSYVEGDPINNADPSGMCPRLDDGVKARECEFLRQDLRSRGVNVVYDIGRDVLEPGSSCLPQQVSRAVNQAQGIPQRFTLGEMSAIHSAVRIFRVAQSNIGFAPLNDTITIQKKRVAGNANVLQQTALGLTTGSTITLSARWWGQGTRQSASGEYVEVVNGQEQEIQVDSIDSFARDPQQYRSWIVLHEIGHVYTTGRRIDLDASYRRLIQDVPQFRTSGYFPTRYANHPDTKEYMIEAITGVWWNSGYSVVSGYDSGAGGRTAPIDMAFADRTIYLNTPNLTTEDPDDTFPLVVINVGSNIWRELRAPITLQDWILNNILSQ